MLSIEDRLAAIEQEIGQAGREASFLEDRGFGGLDPEPYRQRIAAHFQAEPQLERLLAVLSRSLQEDPRAFFSRSDGRLDLDFRFARAALRPSHAVETDWVRGQDMFGPVLQVHAWDECTYILRQSPSANAEAPFLYLLIGSGKALLVDTGAPLGRGEFWPFVVASTVAGLVERNRAFHGLPSLELLVTHTNDSDGHRAGDEDFAQKEGVRMLTPAAGTLDLGGRVVTILSTPGHSAADFSFYDSRTQWLLTGDLLYPGRIHVERWPEFCASVARLVEFTASQPVAAILGSHIEMTRKPGIDFPADAARRPEEHQLALGREHLLELDGLCRPLGDRPVRTVCNDFILTPAQPGSGENS